MWKSTLSVSCALTLTASQSLACAFHNYAPQPTLVDRLLASEHVVLARAGEEDAFRYTATDAIEGTVEDVVIPQLVDSVTRRRFDADPGARVLFARDGGYGPWQRLALVDASFSPVLDDILERLPQWELGDDLDRFNYFAALLEHPDPDVRRLALLELDTADYSILRQLELDIDAGAVAGRINVLSELGLKPIRILLLGLSENPLAAERLRAGLKASIAGGGQFAGAYATALIELEKGEGVAWIADQVLAQNDLSVDARETLVEAMAIHSVSGDPSLRDKIASVLDERLSSDPALAPAVARQYGFRADWSYRDRLDSLLKARAFRMPADIIIVTQYVALADETN